MKKIIATMLVGSVCIAFTACNSQKKDKEAAVTAQDVKKPADDKPVANDDPQTYYITAPEGWTQVDSMVEGRKHTKIGSPSDGPGDKFKENMNVNTEAAVGYDTKSYSDANIATIRKEIPGVEVEDLGQTMLGDNQAECYTYTFDYSGIQLKDIAWYIAKNDVGYVITCTALKTTFDKFEPQFKACASTFKIK